MASSFAGRPGASLLRSPSHRHQALRRRLMVLAAVLGLAVASGVAGALMRPHERIAEAESPFSYFPAQ